MAEEKSKKPNATKQSFKKKLKKMHVSTDIDFRITSSAAKIVLLIVGLVLAVALGGYHVFRMTDNSLVELQTVTAKKINYVKTIEAEAFMLRDEKYLQGTDNGGHAVALVDDGTKVSGHDNVINIFRNESDAQIYYDLQAVETDIAYYENIRNTSTVSTLADISAYEEKVEDSIYSLISTVENGNVRGLKDYTDTFRSAVTKRSIAVGNSVDVNNALAMLYEKRTQMQNKQTSYSSIYADVAGYYVHNTDGFESDCGVYAGLAFAQDSDRLTANVKSIDTATVSALLDLKPVPVHSEYGKLITGFIWYIVCNVPTEEVEEFYLGQRLQVSFPDSQAGSIECKVAAMNTDGNGSTALILSATAMDAEYANLRKTNVVISIDTYTGIKVDQKAVRVVDGEQGVYVLLGNVVRFRNIETIYSEEGFHIVDASGQYGYIKAFDEIIIGGTDLYDGKLVQ